MIISASRRTDIPAFYSQWFFNRLNQGFVMVRNPMNPQLVSKISLNPQLIDCIVFWTKNPKNMIKQLHQLKGYHYYFLFTITPYGPDLEKHLPPKDEVIATFIELSREIGKEKTIWRYDPILITDTIDQDYHYHHFDYIAGKLRTYTGKCIISFLDMYKKCERNLKGFNIKELAPGEMVQLAGRLNQVAQRSNIEMVTCAEQVDLSPVGIDQGKCIDDRLISRITGVPLQVKKDKHQRTTCQCVESIDIGAYNTCDHLCLYCYANSDARVVQKNMTRHYWESPLLLGKLSPGDKIVEREIHSFRNPQIRLSENRQGGKPPRSLVYL